MFFSRTFGSLGARGQRAEGSLTKVKIFPEGVRWSDGQGSAESAGS